MIRTAFPGWHDVDLSVRTAGHGSVCTVVSEGAIREAPHGLKLRLQQATGRAGNMAIETLLLSCPPGQWKTEQVVVFDWYDGPRRGVAALAFPKCEFVFEVVGERFNPDGLDERLFRLLEVPLGSVRAVVGMVTEPGEPSKPVWVPVWRFASEVEKQAADRAVDAVVAEARGTGLMVLSKDMEHFEGVWMVGEESWEQADWFGFLGIPRSPEADGR